MDLSARIGLQADVQTDRQRRKNEELAKEIFGRNRKAKTEQNGSRKLGNGPSLASRVGIAKVWHEEDSL